MNPVILNLAALTGAALGVNQAIKRAFNIPDHFDALIEVVLGIGLALIFISVSRDSALFGLFAGLSAAGLFNASVAVGNAIKPVSSNKPEIPLA